MRQWIVRAFTPEARTEPVLDLVRTFAILLVVAGHGIGWWQDITGTESNLARFPVFYFGWTGVDLFFVLSGYLIGLQIWRELERSGKVDFPSFLIRRGLRIWPLYFLYACLAPLFLEKSWALSDFLFYSNYVQGAVEGGWSLSTEEQFYIVFPLGAIMLATIRAGFRTRLLYLGMLLLSVELARWGTAQHLLSQGATIKDVKDAMYSPGHLRCEGLVLGVGMALISLHRPRCFGAAASKRECAYALLLGTLALAVAAGLQLIAPVVLSSLARSLIYATLVGLALKFRWILKKGTLPAYAVHLTSRLSYGVYLGHFWALAFFMHTSGRLLAGLLGTGNAPFLMTLALGTAWVFLIAACSYLLIEDPFLKLRDRVLRSRVNALNSAPPGATLHVRQADS